MASLRSTVLLIAASSLLMVDFLAEGYGGKVGGKTEIKDVKTNKEVQDLGRFSVEEYNRSKSGSHVSNGGGELKFMEVVEAQKQVVNGIKYYLKISATQNGVTESFDSVVVVKPWLKSKQLLNFSPSAN